MSRRLFSHSLPRDIFGVSREIRMLTSQHRPSPTSEIFVVSPLLLPDVRTPTQYLMDMGLKSSLARRISSVYMDFVARYRQIFESYFRRTIHGSGSLNTGNTECYHNIFVIQFKRTIQVLESQIMSAAWDWLYRAGLSPLHLNRRIDVRVDDATKAQILSRLGLMTTSSVMNDRVITTEPPEEESNTEGDSSTKILLASSPPSRQSITTSTHDPFSRETSLTCFPAYYPPPPREPISSPRKPLITQFHLTSSINNNEKPYVNRCVDMSSLVSRFSQISVITSEVGSKTQDNGKCIWVPRTKKPEPLSPLLSPIVAGQSDLSPGLSSPNTGTASCGKLNPAPRRRRIAALPMRHARTTALPTLDPSSPSAAPPVSAPITNSVMLNNPLSQVAKTAATEVSDSSPTTVPYVPPTQAQYTTGTLDTVESKSVLSKQRKTRPLPRRVVPPQSQTPPPQTRPPTPLAPSGQRISVSNVSRTPSLVSDTSSCADPHSSSDEFDTPPSTPPSYSHGLIPCNALAANANSKSKSNSTGPFGLPILTNADYANLRRGNFIHIDFTNGVAVGERQLSFTFRA